MTDPAVAAIAFDGISPFHLSVPCLVFGADRTELGLPRFDFRVCAIEDGPIRTDAGLTISVPHGLSALDDADIVIVPSWKDLRSSPPAALIDALLGAHERGALIVGLCLGTFAVAATGLLSGRRAATHWAYADQLQELYPDILVEPEVLYIDNGDVVTSAGVAAGLDCCLHVVRARYGAEAALRLARQIVLSPHRQAGRLNSSNVPSPGPALRTASPRLSKRCAKPWVSRTVWTALPVTPASPAGRSRAVSRKRSAPVLVTG